MSRALLAAAVAATSFAQVEVIDTRAAHAPGEAEGFAPETIATGWLLGTVAQDTVQETDVREDAMEARLDAYARVDHRVSRRLRLRLEGWLAYRVTGERDGDETLALLNGRSYKADFEPTLGEAWIDLDLSRVDLRAGTQVVAWGLADLVSPNDVVNPRDLRHGVFLEPETARLPVLALRARAPLGPIDADALWVPFFRADRVDMFGTDWALFGPGAPATMRALGDMIEGLVDDTIEDGAQEAFLQTEKPGESLANSSGGARLSLRRGGYDAAAQIFYGWERLPTVEMHPDLVAAAQTGDPTALGIAIAANGEDAYRAFYRRALSTGGSLGTTLGDVSVVIDSAVTPRRAVALGGGDPFVPVGGGSERVRPSADSPVVESTLGLEYLRGDAWTFHLEGWHQGMLDLPDQPEPLFGGPNLAGAAVLVEWRGLDGELSLRGLAVVEATRGSVVASPQVEWRATDHLALRAGAHLFDGRDGSLGRFYDRNDEAYVGARASF